MTGQGGHTTRLLYVCAGETPAEHAAHIGRIKALGSATLLARVVERLGRPMSDDVLRSVLDDMGAAVKSRQQNPCRCGRPAMLEESRIECWDCGEVRKRRLAWMAKIRKARAVN